MSLGTHRCKYACPEHGMMHVFSAKVKLSSNCINISIELPEDTESGKDCIGLGVGFRNQGCQIRAEVNCAYPKGLRQASFSAISFVEAFISEMGASLRTRHHHHYEPEDEMLDDDLYYQYQEYPYNVRQVITRLAFRCFGSSKLPSC